MFAFRSVVLFVFSLILPAIASAEALSFDSSEAVASIAAGGAVVAALGAAALLITIGAKMWKRFRGAA
jgi:hypothetical protein